MAAAAPPPPGSKALFPPKIGAVIFIKAASLIQNKELQLAKPENVIHALVFEPTFSFPHSALPGCQLLAERRDLEKEV